MNFSINLKRNIRPVVLIMLIICIILSLSLTSAGLARSDSAVVREIQSVLESQIAAWNDGSIEGFMAGYWKSDSLLFTSGGKIQRGWQATFDKYKKSYDTKSKLGILKFSQLEINLLSSDCAWIFGHWELRREKDHPEGVFTLVMKRFPEGWKIVHDHTSAAQSENIKK